MERKRLLRASLVSFAIAGGLLAWILAGCATVRKDGAGTARKPTAIEQVMAWNATLADSNLAIAKAVIAANEAGEIDVATSNTILTAQSLIANADRGLTPILAKACGPLLTDRCNAAVLSNDSALIGGFLDTIRTQADGLIKSGALGIKNPARKQAVQTALDAIYTLADQMVDALKTLGVLK